MTSIQLLFWSYLPEIIRLRCMSWCFTGWYVSTWYVMYSTHVWNNRCDIGDRLLLALYWRLFGVFFLFATFPDGFDTVNKRRGSQFNITLSLGINRKRDLEHRTGFAAGETPELLASSLHCIERAKTFVSQCRMIIFYKAEHADGVEWLVSNAL